MPEDVFEAKTDESWETRMVRDWLRKPFKPEQIGKLPATPKRPALDFVGHAAVTDRLNKIAPDWSYTVDTMSELAGKIWIRGTMTIGGVSRPEFGDGDDPKEAIGNFIRRGAMRFGVAIDLWSREELEVPGGNAAYEGLQPAGSRGTSRSIPSPAPSDGPKASAPAGDTTSPAGPGGTAIPPGVAGDTASGLVAAGDLGRIPGQDPGPGTPVGVGEAPATAPGGQPKPPGVTKYYADPTTCTHKLPSGRWIRWNAEGRCPRCGTTKLLAMES